MFSRFAICACLIAAAVLVSGCGPTMPHRDPRIVRTLPAKAFTHTTGIKFVVVPAGQLETEFYFLTMYQSLLMSAHEVTNAQYEKFLAAYKPTAKLVPKGLKYVVTRKDAEAFDALIQGHKRSKLSPGDDHPVHNVSPEEAEAFCKWLTKNDPIGRKYRPPDVVEWEYAARGGSGENAYPWGDKLDKTNACYNAAGASPVGSFPPNKFGIYDVAGNVAEWARTGDSPAYELRGGSWRDKRVEALHITARGKLPPQMLPKKADEEKDDEEAEKKFEKLEHHGFRVLCEPPPLE